MPSDPLGAAPHIATDFLPGDFEQCGSYAMRGADNVREGFDRWRLPEGLDDWSVEAVAHYTGPTVF